MQQRCKRLTTTRVPISSEGAAYELVTTSDMKFAANPMMVMSEMNCMPRMTVKVMPRAPRAGGDGILAIDAGVFNESRGLDEPRAVRSGRCLEKVGIKAGDEILST
jgi:hypothetical protein